MTEPPPTLNYARSPTTPWRKIALVALAYWTGEVAGADGVTIVVVIAGGDPDALGLLPIVVVQTAAFLFVGACVTGGLLCLVHRGWNGSPPKHAARYAFIAALLLSAFWTLLDVLPATENFVEKSQWSGWI